MSKNQNKAPPKLVVLESYWNKKIFSTCSVRGFLDSMAPLMEPPLQIAHRFVESKDGLEFYTKWPNGVFWTEREAWDAPIYYLAFHGSPGKVHPVLDTIDAKALRHAFAGYGEYKNIVYFGACEVLLGNEGEKFAKKFLQDSGCQAVIGYTTNVDWLPSMITDLLFLSRFYNHENPWVCLKEIVKSVQDDFPLTEKQGWTVIYQ